MPCVRLGTGPGVVFSQAWSISVYIQEQPWHTCLATAVFDRTIIHDSIVWPALPIIIRLNALLYWILTYSNNIYILCQNRPIVKMSIKTAKCPMDTTKVNCTLIQPWRHSVSIVLIINVYIIYYASGRTIFSTWLIHFSLYKLWDI